MEPPAKRVRHPPARLNAAKSRADERGPRLNNDGNFCVVVDSNVRTLEELMSDEFFSVSVSKAQPAQPTQPCQTGRCIIESIDRIKAMQAGV